MARCNFKLPEGEERCKSVVSCGMCKWYEDNRQEAPISKCSPSTKICPANYDAPDAMEKTITSTNSDYTAALRVICEWEDSNPKIRGINPLCHFIRTRLNSAKAPNCA